MNPKNMLVSLEGQMILIDFLPMGILEPFATPEVLEIAMTG
jgi:hypothetical protein